MKFRRISSTKYFLEPRYYFYGWSKSPYIVGSSALVRALDRARRMLPQGYRFKVWDCQRPRYVQIAMIDSFRRRLVRVMSRAGFENYASEWWHWSLS